MDRSGARAARLRERSPSLLDRPLFHPGTAVGIRLTSVIADLQAADLTQSARNLSLPAYAKSAECRAQGTRDRAFCISYIAHGSPAGATKLQTLVPSTVRARWHTHCSIYRGEHYEAGQTSSVFLFFYRRRIT